MLRSISSFPMRALALAALAAVAPLAQALDVPLSADTYTNAASPAGNFGSTITVNVSSSMTGLVRFDLGALPAGLTAANIGKATLVLYVNRVATPGAVEVRNVLSGWAENTVTAAAAPSLSAAGSGPVVAVTAAGQYLSIDVTAQVAAWVASGGASNFGFALLPAASAASTSVFFDSKESSTTGHTARLDVTVVSQGPMGAAGPAGPQGPAGSGGTAGPQGAMGPQGPAGAAGFAGAAGPAGAQGAKGEAGLPGTAGATGPQGATGADGAAGPKGSRGDPGNVGPTGPTGAAGSIGPTGVAGPKGDTGAAGAAGPVGVSVTGPAGRTGDVGNAGNQGPVGAQGPAGVTGAAGITGPAGPAGPAGPTGPTGPLGAQGAQGAPGIAGVKGPTGPSGALGAVGPTGARGNTGPMGPAGVQTVFGTNTGIAAAGYGRDCTLGETILNAGYVANGLPAAGQLLPIEDYAPLFALFGTRYGGNGTSNFGLPDLRGSAPNNTTYSICVQGVFPSQS